MSTIFVNPSGQKPMGKRAFSFAVEMCNFGKPFLGSTLDHMIPTLNHPSENMIDFSGQASPQRADVSNVCDKDHA